MSVPEGDKADSYLCFRPKTWGAERKVTVPPTPRRARHTLGMLPLIFSLLPPPPGRGGPCLPAFISKVRKRSFSGCTIWGKS